MKGLICKHVLVLSMACQVRNAFYPLTLSKCGAAGTFWVRRLASCTLLQGFHLQLTAPTTTFFSPMTSPLFALSIIFVRGTSWSTCELYVQKATTVFRDSWLTTCRDPCHGASIQLLSRYAIKSCTVHDLQDSTYEPII